MNKEFKFIVKIKNKKIIWGGGVGESGCGGGGGSGWM